MLVLLNIISGLVLLGVCFYIFRQIHPDTTTIALVGVLIIGVSYTFGTHFRNASTYIVPITLIAFIFSRMIFPFTRNEKLRVTSIDWIILFIATLLHQASLLFLPALIYAQMNSETFSGYRSVRHKTSIFFLALLCIYSVVFVFTSSLPSIQNFLDWVIGYGKSNFWVFSELNYKEPIVEQWYYYSIYSNKALFMAPVLRSILHLHDYETMNLDNFYLRLIGWILSSVILYFIVYGFFSLARERKKHPLLKLLIFWILPYFILFMFFAPYNSFYRLFYLIPLVVLMLESIKIFSRFTVFKAASLFLLFSYILYNFHCGFIPESKQKNNPFLMTAIIAQQYTSEKDLFIFYDEDYFYAKNMRYFGDRKVAWCRQFSFERHPETSFENIYPACKETSIWLGNNYDNIYISDEYAIDKACLYNLIIITEGQSKPECMVIFPQQIQPLSVNEFGHKRFKRIKINDFAPKSYKNEITGSPISN